MTDEILGDVEPPMRIEVSDEQNEEWHLDNIENCKEYIATVIEENEARLQRAKEEYEEALEWAESEGVDIDGFDRESEAEAESGAD